MGGGGKIGNTSSDEKTLLVINSLRTGGAEKVFIGLANSLANKGHLIEVLVLNLDNAGLYQYLDKRVKLINLQQPHTRRSFFHIRNVLIDGNYKACLVFNFQLTVLIVILKRLCRLNTIIFTRGINTFSEKIKNEKSWLHKYLNGFLIKKLYRNADFFIAQSNGMKCDMIHTLQVPQDKIKVIFNPVFSLTRNEETYREDHRNTKENKELLFVGSLKPQKNLLFMIQSFAELAKRRQDVNLRIVGTGTDLEKLKRLTVKLGVSKKVIFEGLSENPDIYYATADVFLLTSLYEGFPNVILEALSFGVPVVSIDCKSGPADIIIDNVNGCLVAEYNSSDFADKVEFALENRWDKAKIAASIQKFSPDKIFTEYENSLYGEEN